MVVFSFDHGITDESETAIDKPLIDILVEPSWSEKWDDEIMV